MTFSPPASLLADVRGVLDDVLALRRRIHRRPEVGLDLPETQRTVRDALTDLPVDVRLGRGLSAVVAVLEGARPGKTVLLRADMDALPLAEDTGLPFASEIAGRMHACGHDAHVAMLVGAARVLAARRAEIAGRVVLMFQPGEEGYGGAPAMLAEGLLDDPAPDAAFALHVWPPLPSGVVATRPGPMLASSDVFEVVVTGRGGHASMPHHAVDPIPIACEIVLAIQTFMTRRVNVFDPALVTIAQIAAGTTDNVIPETATLLGTIRAVSEAARTRVHAGLREVAEGIALAHGARAAFTLRPGYPVTVNDAGMAARALAVAAALVGPERTETLAAPIMGAEDFSHVLQRVPGAMLFLGVAPPGDAEPVPCHSNRMRIDEPALATGIALHAALALAALA